MCTRIRRIICLLFISCLVLPMLGQDISTVSVGSLSDTQIQRLIKQASDQGMSIDQIIEIAKARGATEDQIDDVRERVLKNGFDKERTNQTTTGKKTPDKDVFLMTNDELYDYSLKAEFEASEKAKKVFGFQFFNSDKLSFEPSINIPVPKDYVLGVNDELTVSIWGASQQTYELTVNHNGAIVIPEAGSIPVQGLTIDDAKKTIKRRLTGIYSGMAGAYPNTWADVSVTGMRSIKVNVIGEVMVAGTYTLPATASAFNALYLCGGPNENGSFRNVRIIRDNKVYKTLDVYEYLIKGDAKNNVALRDQDVIIVPSYDSRVEVAGAFKRIGYFEMKKDETLDDLLKFAGGFNPQAYKSAVSVSRLGRLQRKMIDVEANNFTSFKPENGDSIWVGEVLKRYENRVIITGAVVRPGAYALTQGMKLSDLLDKAQGLKENAFERRGIIYRQEKDLTPSALSFDATDVVNKSSDVVLQREDSVVILAISSLRQPRFVRIYGEVQHAGKFEYYEGMTLGDLVMQSGGFKEGASESFIEVSRRYNATNADNNSVDMVKLFQLSINRDLRLSTQDKQFTLDAFDYVYVRKAPTYYEQKTVTVDGEVVYPGQYSIQSKKERVSDVIKRAGGLTKHAYLNGASLYRRIEVEEQDTTTKSFDFNSISDPELKDVVSKMSKEEQTNFMDSLMYKNIKKIRIARVELQLDKILKDTSSVFNYHLREGDRLLIPEVSEEVHISGAVLNPVGLAFEKGRTAGYYINRSGGFSNKADKSRVYVINSDGTTRVTKRFVFTRYPLVYPGSRIIVPEKEDKEKMEITTWLAIASTFSSLAIAIAAIIR